VPNSKEVGRVAGEIWATAIIAVLGVVIAYIIAGKGSPGHPPSPGIDVLGGVIGAVVGYLAGYWIDHMD
jgi:hypothetical protein